MNKENLKKIFVILAAGLVLIPSLLASVTGIEFTELTNRVFLSLAIGFIMAYVLVDIKDATKKQATGKIAACVGLLYALVMQWI